MLPCGGHIVASLIVVTGANKGDYFPLGMRTNVVGRNEAVPIQLVDPKVSRKHLQIHYDRQTGQYLAVDMNSKHGVLINDVRIQDEQILVDNDYITVGDTTLWFTERDFADRESALRHFKRVGERSKPTLD